MDEDKTLEENISKDVIEEENRKDDLQVKEYFIIMYVENLGILNVIAIIENSQL